jgi:hypothetical protein
MKFHAHAATLELPCRRRDSNASWDVSSYLHEYYSRVEPTEELTLKFLLRTLDQLPPPRCALDFGAGPTLHHALALCGRAREIHVADLLPANLRAIDLWRANNSSSHDWSQFTRAILRLEGAGVANDAAVVRREALLRRRLTAVLPADASRVHPLGANCAGYDLVTSFFCADSATLSLQEWLDCMRNIVSLVAPGGTLVVGALCRCRRWRVGGKQHPSPCIDERHMQFAFDCAGFDRCSQVIEVAAVPDQVSNGFESILLAIARGPRATWPRNRSSVATLTGAAAGR